MRLTFYYLKRMKVFNFLAEIRTIIDRIAASPSVAPHPNPPLEVMEAAWAVAKDAAEKAQFGDQNWARKRREKFEILLNMTVQQGGYISSVCKSATEAENLGFRTAKEKKRIGQIAAPQGVKAKPTGVNNGVEVSWRKTKGAYGFQVYLMQDNPLETEAVWKPVLFTNRCRVTIPNLNPYQKYWFRVVGFSVSGPSPYSNVAMSVVL